MVPLGAGVNDFLRWKELGLDTPYPWTRRQRKRRKLSRPGRWQTVCLLINNLVVLSLNRPVGNDDDDGKEEEEAATEVDDDESLRIDSQDLLGGDYRTL